ncbi:hypothetical protein ORV05_10145 [Amycolatopsis cynarae]|uniref:DUF1648 domain-containing protein n=1 Tax=Amycolatopsis cynarae TaxID=2995223 RepID=A0ABY7B713_9PSEU|nr:hypothetical protein [Amycolatopsis sp. HUAS 11-8]WAL68100.1 hypothetical protein ORV05_10145 [Amycolatopsis sp. HUAS 11-8]
MTEVRQERTIVDFALTLAGLLLGFVGMLAVFRALLMMPLPASLAMAEWRYPYGVELARHGYVWKYCLLPLVLAGLQLALAVLANQRAHAAGRHRATGVFGMTVSIMFIITTAVMAAVSIAVACSG